MFMKVAEIHATIIIIIIHMTQTDFRFLCMVRQKACVHKARLGFGFVCGYCVTLPHSVLVLATHV